MIAYELMSSSINSLMRLDEVSEGQTIENWTILPLGDVTGPHKRRSITEDAIVPFLPMASISDGYSGVNTPESRQWKQVKKGYTVFEQDDVLVAKITPCFQNRKSTIAPKSQWSVGAGTTELHVLRPSEILSSGFLLWFVKSQYFIDQLTPLMTGTAGQKRVPRSAVDNIKIGIPPLDEQHRIVSTLEALQVEISRLAELEREREHLDDQFVDALPSSLLLNFTTPSSKDKHEDWSKVTLAELGKVIGGGTPKSSTAEYWGGDVLWITPADMNFTGKYIEGGRRTLTSSGLANCSARVMKAGSLVISSRAPIGYVKVTAQPLATSQGCKSIELHDVDMSDYLYYSMSAQAPRLASLGTGTTFKEVSGRTVGNFEIDLPPADVRASAVEALDKLMPLVETINKLKA